MSTFTATFCRMLLIPRQAWAQLALTDWAEVRIIETNIVNNLKAQVTTSMFNGNYSEERVYHLKPGALAEARQPWLSDTDCQAVRH